MFEVGSSPAGGAFSYLNDRANDVERGCQGVGKG